MRNFVKLGLTSLFFTQKNDSRYLHQRTGTTFDGFTSVFLVEQKNQKYFPKIRYLPQKVQNKTNSKNGVKTAQRQLVQKY